MEGSSHHERCRRARRVLAIFLVSMLSACSPRTAVCDLPDTQTVLRIAGKRLAQKRGADELGAIAARADQVLAVLSSQERDALARHYCRFRVDRAAVVTVAAARGFAPFWLDDLGFARTGETVRDSEIVWELHRKTYPSGWVGLGVNGLDRRPTAHYAVFVQGLDGRPIAVDVAEHEGWETVEARSGVELERKSGRPIQSLNPDLTGSVLLRKPRDQRHATLLARGRVWKTHVPAATTPDQVAIAFGDDPARTLTFTWRTSIEAESSIVRLRDQAGVIHEYPGTSELVTLPDLLNDPVMRRHTVKVMDLEPAGRYEYMLPNHPAWRPIATASDGGKDLCLLYMGDPQCGLEGWGKLLEAANRHRPDASALLIAGDLVDRGNERTNWDHFFLRAEGVFDRLPMMPAVGNHEYLDRGPWLYRAFFALPENGPKGTDSDLVYSFEAGDAFIAVLDSTAAVSDPKQARLQADWLDDRLKSTRKPWKIVMFHHPLYASHPWRESVDLREAWVPIFDRHHVDLVLQGHDHAYLRTYPMHQDRRVDSTRDGTVYVVSVSGDKYCDQRAADYTEVGFTHVSTYQTIDIQSREGRLIYKAYDVTGRERDGFAIDKPRRPSTLAKLPHAKSF